ncbi:MAG: PQQ-binding-like beta-propeller repeat protein [Verrucomicrobiota bacterium]|jgi:outer membrane protein assembly factor BamB
MNKILSMVFALAAGLFCAAAHAADWPNFRGPNHNGISSESGWRVKWPEEGPKQLWKASLGVGYASIIVANGHAYASGNNGAVATLYCFDAETGGMVWKFSYPSDLYSVYNGPKGLGGTSGAPTIDGDRLYFMSGDGCLYALETKSGAVAWSNNLAGDLGAAKPKWGFATSPLVQDNLLVLDVGGFGTAVDKASGKVVWNSNKAVAGYSTPVPCSFNGTPAVAILSADAAYGVETKSGRQLWSFPFRTYEQLNIADVIVSNNDFFVSAAYNQGGVKVRFDGTNTSQVWANKSFANQINASVLLDGYLYGVDGAVNVGAVTLKCVEFATGADKWSFPGLGGGGLIVADHKIIMLSDKGELVVGEASPASFVPISRAQVVGASCWTAPTLANGRIYCRNNKGDLVCLDVTAH